MKRLRAIFLLLLVAVVAAGGALALRGDGPKADADPPHPVLTGVPSAANTGIVGCPRLKPVHDPMTVSKDHAVVENLDISASITVEAKDVTIRCVRIRDGAGVYPLRMDDGQDTLVEDTDVDCLGNPVANAGIMGSSYHLIRVNVHGCEDGAKVGRDVTVERSYCHDLWTRATGPHSDCLHLTGCGCFTVGNVVIRDNTLTPARHDATSAIMIKSDMGPIDGVTVEDNHMNYGAYTVYSRDGGYGNPTNVRFTNNRFGRNYTFGLRSFDGSVGWSGNVWDDTGQTIAP
jgi:hypothetical protein